jgi:FkbM family methyltransferase|tara:strand:+ start:2490 stop:3179 length:690 start_codon:yes stop_codon:yes gene_type:complete
MSIFTKTKQRFRRKRLFDLGIIPKEIDTAKLYGGNHGWVVDYSKLNSNSVVYSVGVGSNIDFDLALIEELKLAVYAFDPTPRSIEWIKKQSLSKSFKFIPVGLGSNDGEMEFFPPRKESSTHFSPIDRYDNLGVETIKAPVKTLKSLAQEFGHQTIDLLKMDIEGAEYDVIDNLEEQGVEINQILIEFHHMYKGISLDDTKNAIDKLRKLGFELFHISQRTYEFSFRKT